MISRVSGTDAGGLLGYGLRSFPSRDAAAQARLTVATAQNPPVGRIKAASETDVDEVDLLAKLPSTSITGRVYDSSGLSGSLTQTQHVQAGEIDTRR